MTPAPAPVDTSSQTPESVSPSAAKGTTVVVGDSDFGAMLYDDTGQAIYLFDVETTAEPQCTTSAPWPGLR